MKSAKKFRHLFLLRFVFLLCILAVACLVLPIQTTMVSHDLEDVEGYFAALKIQQEKIALQNTLPGKEEVLEIYDSPRFFQVTNTCDWQFVGSCVQVMVGPGMSYQKARLYYENQGSRLERIRKGQVFGMSALIKNEDGSLWYKIAIDRQKLAFPRRIRSDWYVLAEHFMLVDFTPINQESDAIKKVVIILHEQALYAYEGDTLFMKTSVSTGRAVTGLGSDIGAFSVYKKTPMAVMEGPLPGMAYMMNPSTIADFEYTLFVPFAMAYNLTSMGAAFIHQAYWHNGFGSERSHGCINVSYADMQKLYNWTPDPSIIKIPVTVLP